MICYKICLFRLYSRCSSVTSIQQLLGCNALEVCYHLCTVTMMYKAVHNLVHLTFPPSVNLAYGDTLSTHPYKFRHISAHCDAYKFSFSLVQSLYGTAYLCLPLMALVNCCFPKEHFINYNTILCSGVIL